jgi:hypothetical protein
MDAPKRIVLYSSAVASGESKSTTILIEFEVMYSRLFQRVYVKAIVYWYFF